jgi:hypothetical protein
MVMTIWVHHQHDGSSWRLAWDPGTTKFDSSTSDIDEIASFHFLDFTLDMLRIGCAEEWPSEELTKFVQRMISWLIKGSQGKFFVSTVQISAMNKEWESMLIDCITSIPRAQWEDSGHATFVQLEEFA